MHMLVFLLVLSVIATLQAYTQLVFKEAILFKDCAEALGYYCTIKTKYQTARSCFSILQFYISFSAKGFNILGIFHGDFYFTII